MLAAILVFIFLPILSIIASKNVILKHFKSTKFQPVQKIIFFCLIFVFLFLGYIGGNVAEEPFIFAGRVASVLYFFLIILLEFTYIRF
jgi:quinol-cytochrome oxidoreductase complex cytochrome b subunit